MTFGLHAANILIPILLGLYDGLMHILSRASECLYKRIPMEDSLIYADSGQEKNILRKMRTNIPGFQPLACV